jgi:hypothetical protein
MPADSFYDTAAIDGRLRLRAMLCFCGVPTTYNLVLSLSQRPGNPMLGGHLPGQYEHPRAWFIGRACSADYLNGLIVNQFALGAHKSPEVSTLINPCRRLHTCAHDDGAGRRKWQ